MLPGMVPACRKRLQAAGRRARPCPGVPRGPGSVPALAMPAGGPARGSPAAPHCLVPAPAPATGQIPGTAKALRPTALPGRGARCTGTRVKPGQGVGWGGRRRARDGQPRVGWHRGHRAVGCSPASRSTGCGEAQEEPSGEAGPCCAPAVPCFPSYTAQLAGCLYRPELILAALRFPLLLSPPAFPSAGARPPRTRHPPPVPATLGRGGKAGTRVAHAGPLPTVHPSPQCVPQFPHLDDALPRLFHGVCSLPTAATLASLGTCGRRAGPVLGAALSASSTAAPSPTRAREPRHPGSCPPTAAVTGGQ